MALSMDHAMQLLDFSSGKLDVQLLDSVVSRFYEGNGPEVCKYQNKNCVVFCVPVQASRLNACK